MSRKWVRRSIVLLVTGLVLFRGYQRYTRSHNPYVDASPEVRAHFKRIGMPIDPNAHFVLSQGAFGRYTHHEPGLEYRWDFDVPYGTPVVAVDDGTVINLVRSVGEGGCDAKYIDSIGIVQILMSDGTVAQYGHVEGTVAVGDKVKKGQVIGHTANNGFHCTPQLCFCVFKDRDHVFGRPDARNIPVLFSGLPDDGLAREGSRSNVVQ